MDMFFFDVFSWHLEEICDLRLRRFVLVCLTLILNPLCVLGLCDWRGLEFSILQCYSSINIYWPSIQWSFIQLETLIVVQCSCVAFNPIIVVGLLLFKALCLHIAKLNLHVSASSSLLIVVSSLFLLLYYCYSLFLPCLRYYFVVDAMLNSLFCSLLLCSCCV